MPRILQNDSRVHSLTSHYPTMKRSGSATLRAAALQLVGRLIVEPFLRVVRHQNKAFTGAGAKSIALCAATILTPPAPILSIIHSTLEPPSYTHNHQCSAQNSSTTLLGSGRSRIRLGLISFLTAAKLQATPGAGTEQRPDRVRRFWVGENRSRS